MNANQLHRWRRELETHGKKPFPGALAWPATRKSPALKRELAKVKKSGIFARCGGVLCQGIVLRYEAIRRHRDQHPPADVPLPEGLPSGFHDWARRVPSARARTMRVCWTRFASGMRPAMA